MRIVQAAGFADLLGLLGSAGVVASVPVASAKLPLTLGDIR